MKGMCQNLKDNGCLPSSYLPVIFKFFAINIFYFYNQDNPLIFSNIIVKVTWIEDINESVFTRHDFTRFIYFFLMYVFVF